MGYVDSGGKDTGGKKSVDWMSALKIGIPSGCLVGLVGILALFLIDWWIGPAQGPARLRATATHQTLAFPAPVVARPPNFAEMVKDQKDAMLAAEAKARDLDLRVVVETWPSFSAEDVAKQATELANRLQCGLEVHYRGKIVRAWPGMSRESFLKEYASELEADARSPKP